MATPWKDEPTSTKKAAASTKAKTTKAAEKKVETPAEEKTLETIQAGRAPDGEREWLKWDIKPDHMWDILVALRDYEFPGEAIQETTHPTMKKKILGYNAQYIINALNEVIGVNHWREVGDMVEEKPSSAYVSIYNGQFQIGNWKNREYMRKITKADGTTEERTITDTYFEVISSHNTYGWSRNPDHWESLKGARTNFLKKVCSYYSLGWKSYALQLDDDFANLWAEVPVGKTPESVIAAAKKAPAKTPAKPAANKKPAATPPANKKEPDGKGSTPKTTACTKKQIDFINKLYDEYLERSPAGETKTLKEMIEPYEKDNVSDLSMSQASQFIDQFKKHIGTLPPVKKEK